MTTRAAASNGRRHLELAPVKEFQKFCSTTRCGVRVCVYTQTMTTNNPTQPNPTQTEKEITNMNENLIPMNGEVRGVLYYSSLSSGEILSKAGNFQIATDGRTVIARNLNGRNRWNFTTVGQVVDFTPATK